MDWVAEWKGVERRLRLKKDDGRGDLESSGEVAAISRFLRVSWRSKRQKVEAVKQLGSRHLKVKKGCHPLLSDPTRDCWREKKKKSSRSSWIFWRTSVDFLEIRIRTSNRKGWLASEKWKQSVSSDSDSKWKCMQVRHHREHLNVSRFALLISQDCQSLK